MQVVRRQAGDTLIEVLMAVSIFSAVVLGTIIIMNQGISSGQNALEINLVRNQIDTQAELLRHVNSAKLTSIGRNSTQYSDAWQDAIKEAGAPASNYDSIQTFADCNPGSIPSRAFFIHPETGQIIRDRSHFTNAVTYAQIQLDKTHTETEGEPYAESNMLWIEAVKAPTDTLTLTESYDFHIRACWDSSGSGGGLMKLGTIVRLYAPAS